MRDSNGTPRTACRVLERAGRRRGRRGRRRRRAGAAPGHRVRDHNYPVRVYIYLDLPNIYELHELAQ